jgi:sialic acid synthase SpsE
MDVLNKTKGSGSFKINEYEQVYARNGPMKFTIVANRDLKKNQIIKKEDITLRRTGETNIIKQRDYLNLIGKKVKKDIPKMGLVNWGNIEK